MFAPEPGTGAGDFVTLCDMALASLRQAEPTDSDALLREAKQHEGRADDCGRLARLVIAHLAAKDAELAKEQLWGKSQSVRAELAEARAEAAVGAVQFLAQRLEENGLYSPAVQPIVQKALEAGK